MGKKIVVNVGEYESRAAILEDGKVSDLMYEIKDSKKIVGCIFKGRVANIVPGTQAAFVDIGIHKDAYLTLTGVEGSSGHSGNQIYKSPIQDMLKVGQDVVLQILKEPTPTKGPRSTMTLSFPGRYMVFIPKVNHIGISRRISNDKERDRLRTIGKNILPKGTGIVFRTAAEGLEEKELKTDLELLLKMWSKVEEKIPKVPPRTILHRDIPLPMKIARDFFNDDIEEMIIDCEETYNLIMDDCDFLSPLQRASLEKHNEKKPIFEHYGIDKQIERALSRRVWLASGGYIYIDKTEAMYCIDVNSGRYSGGSDLEETVFKLNAEAAKEIARQIRLRNLAGMIIIDFIDMETRQHKNKVLKIFKDGFRGDKNKPNILDFSELGLVQMTRRRTSASLDEIRKELCPCCHGTGKILAKFTIINTIRQQAINIADTYQTEKIMITAHQTIIDSLKSDKCKKLIELEDRIHREIELTTIHGFDADKFSVEPILSQDKPSKKSKQESKQGPKPRSKHGSNKDSNKNTKNNPKQENKGETSDSNEKSDS